MPGTAARVIAPKSTRPRPTHCLRWTMYASSTAKIEQNAAATSENQSELRSETMFAPTYWKCLRVGVKLNGYDSTRALSTSTPYTRMISTASIRQTAKQAQVTTAGTGGRGIEEPRPLTVT